MAEDQTKLKQIYLRTEIIEKGYNAAKFADFLGSKREDGEDIEVWSTRSLEDLVLEFQFLAETSDNASHTHVKLDKEDTATNSLDQQHTKLDAIDKSQPILTTLKLTAEDTQTLETEQGEASSNPTTPVDISPHANSNPNQSPLNNTEQAEKLRQDLLTKALKEKKSTIVFSQLFRNTNSPLHV